MPLVIQHTHTHCSTLVLGKRFLTGEQSVWLPSICSERAAKFSAGHTALPCQTLLQQTAHPATAKYSHRSKDSGGPGTTLCCVAPFLTAITIAQSILILLQQTIHPANPAV